MRSIVIPLMAALIIPTLGEPSNLPPYGLYARSADSSLSPGVNALLNRHFIGAKPAYPVGGFSKNKEPQHEDVLKAYVQAHPGNHGVWSQNQPGYTSATPSRRSADPVESMDVAQKQASSNGFLKMFPHQQQSLPYSSEGSKGGHGQSLSMPHVE